MAFTNALWGLLPILSTWKRPADQALNPNAGMTLELSASSPSDSEHLYRDFRLQDNYPYLTEEDLDPDYQAYERPSRELAELNDKLHNWSSGRIDKYNRLSVMRLLGTEPLDLDFSGMSPGTYTGKFPTIDIVCDFLVRRRFYRLFKPEVLSRLIEQSFGSLRCLRIEHWRGVHTKWQEIPDSGKPSPGYPPLGASG